MFSVKRNRAVSLIGLFSIVFGAMVISGWIFNIEAFRKIFPGFIYLKFNAALCYVLLGSALIVIQKQENKYNKLFFLAVSLLLILISFISFSEYLFHFNAGIDELFIHDGLAARFKYPFPGRMYPQVAIGFILYGIALLGFSTKNLLINGISQYVLHFTTLMSAVVAVSYLYHFSFFNFTNLQFAGATVFNWAGFSFIISIAVSLLRPDVGITSLFNGNLMGNRIASRLFIIVVLIVIVFGLTRQQNVNFSFFSFDAGFSLLTIFLLLLSLAIIWHTANWLNRIDLKRYEAEEEIKAINEKLEQMVDERTAELTILLGKYQESESKFRTAFEFSPIGMALMTLDWKCLKINKRWCEMLGYSEVELLSMSFLEITHPEDAGVHVDVMDRALKAENGVFHFEKRYITKTGAVLWGSINLTAIKDNKGDFMYFVTQFEDISEHKKAEEAQKQIIENEEKLRTLFDNVGGATSLLDTEMRLILFNSVFSEKQTLINGVAPKVGDELYGFLSPDQKKQRFEIVDRVLKGSKETFEVTHVIDGKPLYFRVSFAPVIVDGKVTAISSYAVDLTASKEAEDKIRKADARFKAIVENVFVGIKLNDKDWNIIYRSPAMQMINGWTDDEFHQRFLEIIHPDDIEDLLKIRQEVLSKPGEAINIIYRILHKNGNYVWIESMFCNKLSDPDLEAIITVTRNINERKLVEDKLIKSEEKYRTLVEHASDAIYLMDYQGNFTDANESMCEITGYKKDELLKLNIEQLLPHEELEKDQIKFGLIDPDYALISQSKIVNKNSQIFDVEINAKRIADDRILVIARDITMRMQMENELREAELKFRTMAEKSMVGVYISQNEKLVYVNPRFAEIFGYEPNELINSIENPVEMLFMEKDRDFIRKKVRARHNGEEITSTNFEINGKKKDGTNNRVEFYGSRVILDGTTTIIGTVLDITERAKAEEVLKRSEANLKTIMDTTNTIYVLLDKELNVMAFNQIANKFLNDQFNLSIEGIEQFVVYFPKKEFSQSLLDGLDKFRADRLKQFVKNTNRVLKGETLNYEIDYTKPDGSVCWYNVRLSPITKDEKEIFGLLMELSDISERKNYEENLKSAYLRIQEHINSIKDMTWKQSHLIRGPLANLKGLTKILQENPYDEEALSYMDSELERLDNVLIEMEKETSNIYV